MILEHAVLDVVPGQQEEFEAAFDEARHIIAAMPGFRSLRLERCLERPTRYLLLVEWDSVEAHEQNFRASDRFGKWRAAIGPFFAAPPCERSAICG